MIDEVRGTATMNDVRRGMRVGVLVAAGMSPDLAVSVVDEFRVQRIEWNDDTDVYDITLRHMDEWEPMDVAWIAPDGGDVMDPIQRVVLPAHLRRVSWANRGRMETAGVTVDGECDPESGNP